jgi:hypothetical protein
MNFLQKLLWHREAAPAAPVGRRFSGKALRLTRPSTLRPPSSLALLENLDPVMLARWLSAYERGTMRQVQWLADQVARRDATVRAVLERRASAILDLEWDIRTVDDSPAAEAQAEVLRAAYDGLRNLRAVLRHLAGAAHHGYAVVEVVRDAEGVPVLLEPLPAWVFSRDGYEGPLHLTPEGGEITPATALPADRVIVREVPAPLLHVTLTAYLRKNLGIVDWCGFVETYGVPAIFVIGPPGVPTEQEDDYVAVAEAAISQGKGYLPNGSTFTSTQTSGSGETFEKFLAYLDGQIVLAGTGGKLAVLNEPTGLGGSQGDNHSDAFAQIARAEAAEISEVLQEGIDRPLLAAKFPGAPVLAYWELAAKESPDVGAIVTQAATLATAGYGVDVEQLAERTGYKLNLRPVQAGPATLPLFNREIESAEGSRRFLRHREGETTPPELRQAQPPVTLKTFDERFAEALSLPGAQRRAALEKLSKELPEALRAPAADDPLARRLEADMAAAVVAGAAEAHTELLTNMAPRHGDMTWDAGEYVRDEDGKFADQGGGSASPSKMEGKARERVVRAVNEAIRRKGEVHNVIEISGLGQISIGLGTSGDQDANFKGGWGAAHWQGKHAESTTAAVAELLTKGKVGPSINPTTGQSDPLKREITHGSWLGVIANKGNGKWRLITVYEK